MNRKQHRDLQILREFQQRGIPVFTPTLRMGADGKETGYPKGWPDTRPDDYDLSSADPNGSFCVVTGHGVDVLDIDPRNGADLEAVREAVLDAGVPLIGVVNTPGGGAHFYLPSVGQPLPVRMPQGIDFLARGQNAIAPPSTRPKYPGQTYEWGYPEGLNFAKIGQDTGEVLDFLVSFGQVIEPPGGMSERSDCFVAVGTISSVEGAVSLVESSAVGSRNSTLFTVTARMASLGLLTADAERRIRQAAARAGLSMSEIRRTMQSGMSLGIRRREVAQAWGRAASHAQHLPTSNGMSMKLTIDYLVVKFTDHGPRNVGLSCRELAEHINFSHETANKCLGRLVRAGLIVKEPFVSAKYQSDVYSLPERFHSEHEVGGVGWAAGSSRKSEEEKVDSHPLDEGEREDPDNQSYLLTSEEVTTSTYPSVKCQPSPFPSDHLRDVFCHNAFTRGRGANPLPPRSAETLLAIESGATTVAEVQSMTGMGKDTVRLHFVVLESAGLIRRRRGRTVVVEQLWDGDVISALDEWCAQMGIGDLQGQRREKHQIQRDYYNKWGT